MMFLSLLAVAAVAMAAPTSILPPHEAAALEAAAVAVAEMERLAANAEEKELAERDRLLVAKAKRLAEKRAAARSALQAAQLGGAQLQAAMKKVQEVEMSFNLQYLQLQSQMQNENRRFTIISNIMKTKHETVKNSISNIR